jgi:hypothetical protein
MAQRRSRVGAGSSRRKRSPRQGQSRRRLLFEELESRQLLSTVTWDGGGDRSSWTDPLNWNQDALPGPADDVVISAGGNVTVTHASGTDSIRSFSSNAALVLSGGSLSMAAASNITNGFTFSGGVLSGQGELTVTGTMDWSGGTLAGNGAVTIAPSATLTLSGPNLKDLSQRTLNIAGTAVWTGGTSGPATRARSTSRPAGCSTFKPTTTRSMPSAVPVRR